ncbi:MAG: hypothetical protein EBE86_028770 [Hormoscilla sp. GUM202]|nr:hypothetical protein [Hormoscilla sp. GUM202]
MKFDSVDPKDIPWQESLDPKLMRRLMGPISQQGVAGTQLAESILLRMQAMTDRSPLAIQLGQRQHWVAQRSADAVPIVYARPASMSPGSATPTKTSSDSRGQNVSAADLQPSVRKPSGPVIQAKFARPPEKSPADFSQPPIAGSPELPKRPLVRARSAIFPDGGPNVVEKFPKVREHSNEASNLPGRLAVAPSAKNMVVQRKLARPVVRENSPTDGERSPVTGGQPTPSTNRVTTGGPGTNSTGKTLVVQRKLARPVVRENNPTDGERSTNRVPTAGLGTNSTGKTLVVQRKLARPVVRENNRTDGERSPVPLQLATASNGGGRTGKRVVNNHTSSNNKDVIQRQSSPESNNGVIQRQFYPNRGSPTIIQRSEDDSGGGDADNKVEEIADRVQRLLMQRLTIETERRGLSRWF